MLPEYDRALLLRELQLFPEWYIARHKGVTLTDAETAMLDTAFERILAVNLAEPQVFVHRDYHSRNLMLLDPADGLGANPASSTSRTRSLVRSATTWCRCSRTPTSTGTRTSSSTC